MLSVDELQHHETDGRLRCEFGGSYPILRPYRGVIWMELSGGDVRLKSEPTGSGDGGAMAEQRNGITRFGDRFLRVMLSTSV